MKFILIESQLNDELITLTPIIFPKELVHVYTFEFCKDLLLKHNPNYKNIKVVSAGFLYFDNVKCFGESETLNVKCHSSTEAIINMIEYFHVYDIKNKPIKD